MYAVLIMLFAQIYSADYIETGETGSKGKSYEFKCGFLRDIRNILSVYFEKAVKTRIIRNLIFNENIRNAYEDYVISRMLLLDEIARIGLKELENPPQIEPIRKKTDKLLNDLQSITKEISFKLRDELLIECEALSRKDYMWFAETLNLMIENYDNEISNTRWFASNIRFYSKEFTRISKCIQREYREFYGYFDLDTFQLSNPRFTNVEKFINHFTINYGEDESLKEIG